MKCDGSKWFQIGPEINKIDHNVKIWLWKVTGDDEYDQDSLERNLSQ